MYSNVDKTSVLLKYHLRNALEKLFLSLDSRHSTKECHSTIDESLAPKASV